MQFIVGHVSMNGPVGTANVLLEQKSSSWKPIGVNLYQNQHHLMTLSHAVSSPWANLFLCMRDKVFQGHCYWRCGGNERAARSTCYSRQQMYHGPGPSSPKCSSAQIVLTTPTTSLASPSKDTAQSNTSSRYRPNHVQVYMSECVMWGWCGRDRLLTLSTLRLLVLFLKREI